MAVFALLSAGGSPGVTTAALALTLSWPSQVIIAECDPSGGDILAGLLGGHLPATTGLLPLALEAGAGTEVPTETLWRQLVELDEEHNRLLLAGISDPRQSAALQSSLPWIAESLQGLRADVLADCGRLDALADVRPVLSAASLAVLVLRPTLRQVSRALPRIEMLTGLMGRDRVVLLLVGDGPASKSEIAKTLGVPVAGLLPADPRTASVLSDGEGSRKRLDERPLIRAATVAGRGIRAAAQAAGPLPGLAQTVYTPYAEDQPGLPEHSGGYQDPGQLEAPAQQPGWYDFEPQQAGQPAIGMDQPGWNWPITSWSGQDDGEAGPAGAGQPDSGAGPAFAAEDYRAFGADQYRIDPYEAGQHGSDGPSQNGSRP